MIPPKPKNSNPKLRRLTSALTFAAIGSGTLALGLGLVWRALARDNEAFVQQSIGDASSMLAVQVRLELDRLERVLNEAVQDKVRAELAAQAAATPGASDSIVWGAIETEPEISDISLWRRLDTRGPSVRAYLGVNSRYVGHANEPLGLRLSRLQELAEPNRARLEAAFHGHALVLADPLAGQGKPLALIALPLGHGEVSEVVAAHVNLEKIQKLFAVDALVQSALIDRDGMALAHWDGGFVGKRESDSAHGLRPLFDELSAPTAPESGLRALTDEQGQPFYGGFRKIVSLGVAVLSAVPAEQAGASVVGTRHQLTVYVLAVFAVLLLTRYTQLTRGVAGKSQASSLPPPAETAAAVADPPIGAREADAEVTPRKAAVIALHGSLRGFNQILDGSGPEEATEVLNDYLTAACAIVRGCGGRFGIYGGGSFGASWELLEGGESVPLGGSSPLGRAVTCALSLREEMDRINESRKLDGKKPLKQGIGMHVGQALVARIGVIPDLRLGATGEALACARALDRLALAEAKDLVVSQEVIKSARGVFKGKSLGEARLTSDTGLTAYYSVTGFHEDTSLAEGRFEDAESSPAAPEDERMTGGETRVSIVRSDAPPRWLINNGSQIVGPFTAREISQRLFSQELDFDCECWHEESGRSSSVAAAGIFTGSDDAGARYWVFDGELVHGPVSEGFVRTALQRDALSPEAHFCDNSTISGWRPIQTLLAAATDRKPDTDSGEKAA